MIKEYTTVQKLAGPLLFVNKVSGISFNELVEIELVDGTTKNGQVLEVGETVAVVQVFEGTAGIETDKMILSSSLDILRNFRGADEMSKK